MIKVKDYEAKTREEALDKCLKELDCKESDLVIREETIEGKLFKSGKYILHVYRKEEIEKYIKEYINKIAHLINIPIECDILKKEEGYQVTLVSDHNAILIGKEGRTLNALQLLIKQSIQQDIKTSVKINIDASNYKIKKMKNIENEIKKIAKEILDTKIDVELDPMNSYERRMVHSLISEYKNLETESIGDGKNRHIIIKYVEE